MKKPTVWAGKSARAVFVSLRCLLHGIAGTGARRFPFISKMEGFFDEKKSLAHCSGGGGDPHVYRKCVCMERPDAPCDGDDGALAFFGHLGLLDRDPVSGAFGRLLRPSGRAAGAVPERDGLCRLFQYGSPWDSGGGSLSVRFPALSLLRSHRGHWSWHGLYHACLYACEMVSSASRLCDGAGYHGVRLRSAHRRPGHALSCRPLRTHGEFPHPRRCLCAGHDPFRFLHPAAEEG